MGLQKQITVNLQCDSGDSQDCIFEIRVEIPLLQGSSEYYLNKHEWEEVGWKKYEGEFFCPKCWELEKTRKPNALTDCDCIGFQHRLSCPHHVMVD